MSDNAMESQLYKLQNHWFRIFIFVHYNVRRRILSCNTYAEAFPAIRQGLKLMMVHHPEASKFLLRLIIILNIRSSDLRTLCIFPYLICFAVRKYDWQFVPSSFWVICSDWLMSSFFVVTSES